MMGCASGKMSAIVAFLAVNNAKNPWRGHAKEYVRKHPHFETALRNMNSAQEDIATMDCIERYRKGQRATAAGC
jgi:hypothetical protein